MPRTKPASPDCSRAPYPDQGLVQRALPAGHKPCCPAPAASPCPPRHRWDTHTHLVLQRPRGQLRPCSFRWALPAGERASASATASPCTLSPSGLRSPFPKWPPPTTWLPRKMAAAPTAPGGPRAAGPARLPWCGRPRPAPPQPAPTRRGAEKQRRVPEAPCFILRGGEEKEGSSGDRAAEGRAGAGVVRGRAARRGQAGRH